MIALKSIALKKTHYVKKPFKFKILNIKKTYPV